MMYKVRFEPQNKIQDVEPKEVTFETATRALATVEELVQSDEKCTIYSDREGRIDLHFLRVLANKEQQRQ